MFFSKKTQMFFSNCITTSDTEIGETIHSPRRKRDLMVVVTLKFFCET